MKRKKPSSNIEATETVQQTAHFHPDHLITLFNRGWHYMINQRWQEAEAIFAKIDAHHPDYSQDGLSVTDLRYKANYEIEAAAALEAGNLEAALNAFRKADDFKQAKEVHALLTIQELEERAKKATAVSNHQQAAWVYDHLLNEFPNIAEEKNWAQLKEQSWQAELLPVFYIGQQALEKSAWRTAYKAFSRIIMIDPYFRHGDHSAAALAEVARKEVVLAADQLLRQGLVQQALAAYREVGHQARMENVDEFLRLRQQEEKTARELEARGKWQEAAKKYNYLRTLYYDENGRHRWQTAADRCLQASKLSALYEQGFAAYQNKQWAEAARLFGTILSLQPDYHQGDQPVRKLYRAARWRKLLFPFASRPEAQSPRIPTGNLTQN